MGRHSDPDRGAFWRSLGAAAGKAFLVLAGLAVLTAGVALLAQGRFATDSPAVVFDGSTPTPLATPAADPTHEPREATAAPDPSPESPPAEPASPEPVATAQPTPTPAPPEATPQPVDDVRVQVIDSGGGDAATSAVVELLEAAGYEVAAVGPGRCCYEQTTVFYSEGRDELAEALQAREPRFEVIELNTVLDQRIDLHVVVGEDWEE